MYRDLTPLTTEQLGLEDVEPPEEFDWEFDRGIKTEVKHQQDCGGCWAFATSATIESQYFMKYGENISLSEQQLIDCDENNLKCSGGNMRKAFIYLQEHGLMKSEDYPFINGEGECKYDEKKGIVKVKEFSFIPKDEEEMKKALFKYGPIASALNSILMVFYDSGIYEPWYSSLCSDNINHAVVIVGWTKTHWIIQNSWDSDSTNTFWYINQQSNPYNPTYVVVKDHTEKIVPIPDPEPQPAPTPVSNSTLIIIGIIAILIISVIIMFRR